GVFISYSKDDQPKIGGEDAGQEYVWLRLHNNLIWDITVCSYDKEHVTRDILGLHYEMERRVAYLRSTQESGNEDGSQSHPQNDKVPLGIPSLDSCSEFVLNSGKAIYFRVNRT